MKYFKDFTKHLKESTDNPVPGNDSDSTKVSTPKKPDTQTGTDATAPSTPVPNKEVTQQTTDQKSSPIPLQNKLKEWSQKYSQAFKFINDKPFTTEVGKDYIGQFAMLLNVVVAEKKQAVQEAILAIIEILVDKRFKDYTVQIIGHTSTPGPKGREAPYNQALSERRAMIVYHAIQDKSTELKKDLAHVKFQQIGKGLTDPIILNDKTLDPLKIKKMDGEFDAASLEAFSKSVEERQKINRRVIITLPDYKEPVPVVKVAPVVKSNDERFPRIKVQGIQFTDDSYILTEESKTILNNIVTQIDARAKSTQKIETVYLSAHTDTPTKKSDTNDKMMYILSLNRGLIVEKYMSTLLKSKIKFVRYACSGQLSTADGDQTGFDDDKRVQMKFNEDLPKAKKVNDQLSSKYDVPVTGQIVPNNVMRQTIIQAINAYFEDDQLRQQMVECSTKNIKKEEYFKKIPREFWIENETYESLGEDKPDEFKDEVETLFRKLDKKYDTSIQPSVLFHDDLTDYLAKVA